MSYFAKVENSLVTNVIAIDQSELNSGLWGDPSLWVQTSYNTKGGIHYGSDNQPDGGVALRGNYAGIGYTYDIISDVFYAPQPYPSWTISAPTWLWQPPLPYPTDGGVYNWDEATLSWVKVK